MNKIKTNSVIFVFLALSIVFFSLWFLILKFSEDLKRAGHVARAELETAQEKIKKTKSLEAVLNELNTEKTAMEEIILTKDGFIKLVENLEFLATTTNIKLNIKSAQINDSGLPPILSLETKGGFADIYRFVKMVESLPYIISFERLTLQKNFSLNIPQAAQESGQKNDGQNYKWIMEATFKILSYKNKE